MVTEAKTSSYWIANNAIYIELNAMDEPNYVQGNVSSGAYILCYMRDIEGLGYDAGHNYQRWQLSLSPSVFPDNAHRYIYVAIPRIRKSDNDLAIVCFPSVKIDIYGKEIVTSTLDDGSIEFSSGEQIGSADYYYIFLQGEIAASENSDGVVANRKWVSNIECGTLSSDESIASGGEGSWWQYNSVSDTISFVKKILSATFEELSSKVVKITKLVFGDRELTGIADDKTSNDSSDKIVTPLYLSSFGSKQYLSRINDDIAQGFIEFLKGLKSDELATFLKGFVVGNNGYAFDESGNIVINSAQSLDFDDTLQKGFGLSKNSLGKYELSLTNLFIWGKAVFNELEIRKLSSVGGNVVLSAASSKIVHVEEYSDSSTGVIGWKCYLLADDGTTATTNGWKKFDQARCQQFNIKEGTSYNVSNRDYWRAVVDVSTEAETIYGSREVTNDDGTVTTEKFDLYDGKKFDWIVLSATNCRKGKNDAPMAGDTIVLDGHQQFADNDPNSIYNDEDRTNLIMLETTGAVGVPRIVAFTGITDFEHDDKNRVFILSPKEVIFVSKFFKFISASGNPITLINNRGAWEDGTKYYYYDQVVYENAYWTCIAEGDKEPTTEKPSLDSEVWRKDLEIGDAVKVENTEILYAIGDGATSPAQPADDKFIYNNINEALADIKIGDYLWSKTIVTYTDGHDTVTYGVSRLGEDGAKGEPGANGMTTHFAYAEGIVFDDNGNATGVSGNFSTTLFNGAQYIGTYTDSKTADSTNPMDYKWTKLKGERGDKGDKGEQGDKGADAVVYSIVMSYASMHVSSVITYGIRIYFRKMVGNDWDNFILTSDKANGYCKVYIDGSQNASIANYLNSGNGFIDYSAYSDVIKANSKIRVDWYDKDDALLAIGNYSVAGGSVIAYCNSDTKPSKPAVTDINNLSGGWSLTPKSGGTTTKFSGVSYGNYSVGATKTGYTTSEWSEVTDGGYAWRKSPAGLSDNYGWALMKVSFTTNVDNVDIEVRIKGYSEVSSSGSPWDTIQVYGLDEEVSLNTGTSYAKGGVAYAGGNGVENSNTYNIAKAGQHYIYVAYAKDSSNNDNGDYGLFRIVSQAAVSLSSVVWMSKADVKDGRVQLPWSDPVKVTGEDGEKGEDAVSVVVEDAPLIFDTDDNGLVPTSVSKVAKVKVFKGAENVTANVTFLSSQDGLSMNAKSSVSLTTNDGEAYIKVTVSGSNISNDYIDSSDTSKGKVSASSGYAKISFVYAGKVYKPQVPFQVNVSKFTGSMMATSKKFQTSYSELTNGGTITSLTDYKSEILQTSREISLSVSEKAVGRRNMLPGSALRKQDDGPEISLYSHSVQGIMMNGGIGGTNCLRCDSYFAGSSQQYAGLFWRGGGASKNIKIQPNKKYFMSCWVKCNRLDATIALEVIYKPSENADTSERKEWPLTKVNKRAVSEVNVWELFTCEIDTSNAAYNYIEANFWVSHNISGVTATAFFCRPMLEEAEEYNGWTLSSEDYDYIGANIVPNSRTFSSGSSIRYATQISQGYNSESTVLQVSMKSLKGHVSSRSSLPSSASVGDRYALDDNWEIWEYDGNSISDSTHYNGWYRTSETLHQDFLAVPKNLELNKDYIVSWYAKSSNNSLVGAYAIDSGKTVYSEYCDGSVDKSTYGEHAFLLSNQWKRYWMHVRLESGSCSGIVFRQYRGDYGARPAMTVYFAQPKIEEGCTMTDWTEKRTDMVDKQALLDTGIDITNKQITITADNTIVQDNSGKKIALLNSSNGYINTSLLNVEHIYLKNQSSTVYGHFGFADATGGTDKSGYKYPLWIGASTAQNANFSVREDGTVYATKGKIGPLDMDEIGLYIHPLNINNTLRKGADFRSGGFWISQDNNDCNNELMVGSLCWNDPLNANEKNTYTTTTLGSAETYNASVIVAKKWNSDSSGDSRVDPSVPALMVESKGVGITSFALNFLGGMAAGCIRASSITGDTLTAMHLNRISMVVMTNSSAYTFPLPKNPVEGQILIVVQGNGQIWFDTAGKTIYCGGSIRNNTRKFDSNTVGQFNIFLYDGYYWQLQFIREKA